MADEPNIPTHRWYQKQRHIKLPKSFVSKTTISDAGIQLIDGVAPVVPAQITGTAPSIGPLIAGDTLGSAVTWGAYFTNVEGAEIISPPPRFMKLNDEDEQVFDGDILTEEGQNWQVFEEPSDSAGTGPTRFSSNISVVDASAPAGWFVTAGDASANVISFPTYTGAWSVTPGDGQANVNSFPEVA